MELPGGRPLIVDAGILLELAPEDRVILWVPGERARGFQQWERVSTAARAVVTTDRGVSSIAAALVPIRQRLGGSVTRLFRVLIGSRADRAWTLPGGEPAEQCGERRTDLCLAWADEQAAPVDDERINALWPQRRGGRALGPNLYLVEGVGLKQPPASVASSAALPPEEPPRALAKRVLESARAAGDRPRTVTALADLGLALLLDGDVPRAAATLAEARAGARELGDPALEADVMSNLALAACLAGQPAQARGLITPVLGYARAVGDRYAEKLALDRLAQALVGLSDHAAALACLLEAAAVAAELDDRRHEAELLWRAAIEHAELGERDRALAAAHTAVERLRALGNPAADWYAQHVKNYRAGAQLAGSDALTASHAAAPTATATGPGTLRMALTAARAMAAFVGSGFRMTPPESYRARVAVCVTCEHHTGIRCRLCGCITAAKARMLHEKCPAGRWPA